MLFRAFCKAGNRLTPQSSCSAASRNDSRSTSEVKCLHYHGTEVRKPLPSYQIYKGTVFDLVDQAIDFVMSKITRAVGTRAQGLEVPVTYELPREAVAEAIVNAPCSHAAPVANHFCDTRTPRILAH